MGIMAGECWFLSPVPTKTEDKAAVVVVGVCWRLAVPDNQIIYPLRSLGPMVWLGACAKLLSSFRARLELQPVHSRQLYVDAHEGNERGSARDMTAASVGYEDLRI